MPQAIFERQFGGPEVMRIEELARPSIKADEVLVSVYAASVNPVDTYIRQGSRKETSMLPFTPGCDIAGIVSDAGKDAGDFEEGDKVYGMIGFTGGYAEYAVSKAFYLAPKPESLDFVHAAAVPLTALAAWQCLFEHGGLKSGQRILIHGSAGAVGGFAVQFAKNAGAYVIGTASAQDAGYVSGLGADEVIDYKALPFEKAVMNVDFVLDVIGGETQERSWQVLKSGGVLITTKNEPSAAKTAEKKASIAKRMLVHPSGTQLRGIGALIDAGKIKVEVNKTFPLSQAAQAHEYLQSGRTSGKIVLVVKNAKR
jgi:NADPH:quinone reductase-like Zn-dependent oxidoreductase